MSSLYGADAMGGVINIITKKAEDGQLHGSIFGQYNRADRGDGKTSTVMDLTSDGLPII